MPVGLIALALGGFGIGLTEFVIMGLLPEVAADFRVSEAEAGWFISSAMHSPSWWGHWRSLPR